MLSPIRNVSIDAVALAAMEREGEGWDAVDAGVEFSDAGGFFDVGGFLDVGEFLDVGWDVDADVPVSES